MNFQSTVIVRLLKCCFAASLLWLLSACVGQPKVVSSPQVLLQELSAQGQARVVLHNFSNVPMTFSELRYTLKFDANIVASGSQSLNIEVPQNSPEQITLTLKLSPEAMLMLKNQQAIAYGLEGLIISSKPSRKAEYVYQGKLTPVPGKPGFWR